jgi:glycosyltransferase involved in cell wall biosynthesis
MYERTPTAGAAWAAPEVARSYPSYRVLKLAPTGFFADYGCHVRIYEEAVALRRHGSQVVICTYPSGRDLEGLTVVRSLGLPGGREVRVGSSPHKLYLDVLLAAAGARTALGYRPDVVHGHLHEGALIGWTISRALRRPLVFDFQGSLTAEMIDHSFLSASSRWYRPMRWLEQCINHWADAIITSSRPAADLLVREFGCPARKVVPVPDGVDVEVFRPAWEYPEQERARLRAALGIPPGRQVVVYLGLLAEYQGSSYLLQAAAEVLHRRPDVHFLLMGYPGEERYRSLAQRLGIGASVTFTGRVPYERAPRYLAAGTVAVAPKLSLTEANGKLLNYMALGLPTVAFDSAVSRDVLGPAGVFAPMADASGLARNLLHLLDDESDASSRGRALRRRVEEQFSWSAAAGRILDVYGALAEK